MKLDCKLSEVRLPRSQVLVELPTLLSNEVKFNEGTLEIVSEVKEYTFHADDKYMSELRAKIRKNPWDKDARKELMQATVKLEQGTKERDDFEGKQARRVGVLASLPIGEDKGSGWDFSCGFDAKVGDTVYWDSFYTKEQYGRTKDDDDKILEIEGKRYLIIPSRAIFCAVRGNDVIAVNGFIIGRKKKEKEEGIIKVVKADYVDVEVVAAPISYPTYKEDIWGNTEVEKGDIIRCRSYFAIPLDSTISSETDLVRVACRTVISKQ